MGMGMSSYEEKKFKDPVYGYIRFSNELVNEIIDTAPFQRLRRIIQTNYSCLYLGAVHNRFSHSLGVYYLGKMASNALQNSLKKKQFKKENYLPFFTIFEYACLLHDIGHAPFSHVCEQYYSCNNDYKELHKELINIVGKNPSFSNVIQSNNIKKAKPHEIMSAIIGIESYENLFLRLPNADEEDTLNEYKAFFARCITGYTYTEKSLLCSFKNCLIGLLNSDIIDVDKLDYIIRDIYYAGFQSINLDYKRVLKSLMFIKKDNCLEIAFYKDAISVLENIIYATDFERKWVHNHNTILYETYLLRAGINKVREKLESLTDNNKLLFSKASLSYKGTTFIFNDANEKRVEHISLLSDDDIVCLLKKYAPDDIKKQYFDRSHRLHPLWKSKQEYLHLLRDITTTDQEELQSFLNDLSNLSSSYENRVVDNEFIKHLKNELKELKSGTNNDELLTNIDFEQQISVREKILQKLERCKSYLKSRGVEKLSFVILPNKDFETGFKNDGFGKINIAFSKDSNNVSKFISITTLLKQRENSNCTIEDVTYLFLDKKIYKSISVLDFIKNLLSNNETSVKN